MLCRGAANKTGELCNKAFRRGKARSMQRLFYMRFFGRGLQGQAAALGFNLQGKL